MIHAGFWKHSADQLLLFSAERRHAALNVSESFDDSHRLTQPRRQDVNGQMPASTCACLHIHTALRQPDREVYIISLGSQPEPTQSFHFYESPRERRKETDSRKAVNETKTGGTTELLVYSVFFCYLSLMKHLSYRPTSVSNHVGELLFTDIIQVTRQQTSNRVG